MLDLRNCKPGDKLRRRDGGEAWSEPAMIFRGYSGATNGAIETQAGTLLVPISYDVANPGRLVSACIRSTDGGLTWTTSDAVDIGGQGDHGGALEPTVVELQDGRIWLIIRTDLGRFFEAFSTDQGQTWSTPEPTALASPHSPGYILRLASGRLAFAWNNTMATSKDRRTMSIAISKDDGQTWATPVDLATAEQLSYPYICEVIPGRLIVACQQVHPSWQQVTPVLMAVSEADLL